MKQKVNQYQMVIDFWIKQRINQPEDWLIKKANQKIKQYKKKLEDLKWNK